LPDLSSTLSAAAAALAAALGCGLMIGVERERRTSALAPGLLGHTALAMGLLVVQGGF
jgi:uncharacterized membrane protein YhiD involved in acid resistance